MTDEQLQYLFGKDYHREGDSVVVHIGPEIMHASDPNGNDDLEFEEWRGTCFAPFVEGWTDTNPGPKDYEWNVAREDDMPNAITINNMAMLADEKIATWLSGMSGPYDEEDEEDDEDA